MAAEIPDGAFIVARAIFNSSLWTMRPEDCKLAVTLIGMANWKDKNWFDGEKERLIRRGEFVTSLKHLAEATHLSFQSVRTGIKNLSNTGFLTQESTRHYTVIKLLKYDKYQDLTRYSDHEWPEVTQNPTHAQHTPNTRLTHAQHTGNTRLTTTNNTNKANNADEGEEGKKDAPVPAMRSGSTSSLLASKYLSLNPTMLSQDKATNKVEFYIARGADPKRIEAAFMDPLNRGKNIWEILDPLAPGKKKRTSNDLIDDIKSGKVTL